MSRSSTKLFVAPDEINYNATSTSHQIQPIPEPNTAAVVHPKSFYQRRAIRSKGAILVLIISTCVSIGKLSTLNLLLQSLYQPPSAFTLISSSIFTVIGVAIPQLFYPLAGWLADTRFGRHRVIQISMWCMWLGECILSVTLLLFELCQSCSPTYHHVFKYFLFPVSFVMINVGGAGFRANIIQFGMDQMVDASGDQMSAFIHWYYWTTFVGGALFSMVMSNFLRRYTLYTLEFGFETLLLSVALLCWYKLKHWLIVEPQCQNPFKIVYDVIKFASKHKRPLYRSALTYWDDRRPSRIDLGKSKYGGPFSTEEVESVKSFIAITGVLLSLGLCITAEHSEASSILNRMTDIDLRYSVISAGRITLFASQILPILLVIPVCELMIYPLMHKCIPTILNKIGIGIALAIMTNVILVVLYATLHSMQVTHQDPYCFWLNSTGNRNETLPAPIIAVPLTINSISALLVYIAGFEFICAQSPYSLRGMLIGTFYGIQGLFTTIAALAALAIASMYTALNQNYGCGYMYYPFMLVTAIVGCVVYLVVRKRYKGRERDEHVDHHIFAENYYS